MQLKKKAKGKGKKAKAALTPEEALRQKMEALAEEERIARERELRIRARIRQIMELEAMFSRVNGKKIQIQWRNILRHEKVEGLKKDAQIMSQIHDREVDRKNALIAMLDEDLDLAEEQYQTSTRSHLRNVDALLNLQHARVKDLEDLFTQQVGELSAEFQNERTNIVAHHTKTRKEMNDIMGAMDHEYNDSEADAKHDFESQMEDIRNKNSEEYNVLRLLLESTIEDLERHFEAAHQNYLSNTEKRTENFKVLTVKDQQSAKTIDIQLRKLTRLQEQLSRWKMKIANNAKECEERNKLLKEEKDEIAAHYQQLKRKMNRARDAELKRLSQLSQASHKTIKVLKTRLDLVERILKMAELNRKMESESEKVRPFYKSSIDDRDVGSAMSDEDVRQSLIDNGLIDEDSASYTESAKSENEYFRVKHDNRRFQSSAVDSEGKPLTEWDYLNNFYKKLNKALLDKLALGDERSKLAEENRDLKSLLRQYLNGMSVNEEVLQSDNPLLVVNDRVNIARPVYPEGADMSIPQVEANQQINSRLKIYNGGPTQSRYA